MSVEIMRAFEIAKELTPQSQNLHQDFGKMGNSENQALFADAMKIENAHPSLMIGKLAEVDGVDKARLVGAIDAHPDLVPQLQRFDQKLQQFEVFADRKVAEVKTQLAAVVRQDPSSDAFEAATFGGMIKDAMSDLRATYDKQLQEFKADMIDARKKKESNAIDPTDMIDARKKKESNAIDPTDMIKMNYALLVMGAMTTMVTTAESNIKGTLQQLLTAQ